MIGETPRSDLRRRARPSRILLCFAFIFWFLCVFLPIRQFPLPGSYYRVPDPETEDVPVENAEIV